METAIEDIAVSVAAVLKMAARPRRGADISAFDFWPQNDLTGKNYG